MVAIWYKNPVVEMKTADIPLGIFRDVHLLGKLPYYAILLVHLPKFRLTGNFSFPRKWEN